MSTEFAGTLSERLTLLVRAAARDALGGASGAWTVGATLWACVRPDSAGPEGESDAPGAEGRWRAIVRAPVAVAAQDRVQWRGRTLRVRRIEADPAAPDRVTLYLEEIR